MGADRSSQREFWRQAEGAGKTKLCVPFVVQSRERPSFWVLKHAWIGLVENKKNGSVKKSSARNTGLRECPKPGLYPQVSPLSRALWSLIHGFYYNLRILRGGQKSKPRRI